MTGLITLLTDFGNEDAYVAQMKGQMLSINPQLNLIDITHQVQPQDVAQGALLLAQAAPYFPSGTVHVCVVDPGVGTNRSLLAVEVWFQSDPAVPANHQRFVLPDNGLIDLCLQQSSQWQATYLTNETFWRSGISSTFHGRDIMGPVAAHWLLGTDRSEFGSACTQPVRLGWPQPTISFDMVSLTIVAVDHFGNLVTNLKAEQATFLGASRVKLVWEGHDLIVPLAKTYGQRERGEPLLLVGSHGFVELAVACGHAARQLGIVRGQQIEVRPRS